MQAALAGFALGLSLILAIGAQNVARMAFPSASKISNGPVAGCRHDSGMARRLVVSVVAIFAVLPWD